MFYCQCRRHEGHCAKGRVSCHSTARRLPIKLSPYRYFVLRFDEYYIRLDADTNQHWILAADSQYRLRYRNVCASISLVN